MKVKIENYYEDGHHCSTEIELPEPPAGTTVDGLDESNWDGNQRGTGIVWSSWWQENVRSHTGCGHGQPKEVRKETASGIVVRVRSLDSGYFAEIVEAADPQLVGAEWEWC